MISILNFWEINQYFLFEGTVDSMCLSLYCGNSANQCSARGGNSAADGTTCASGKVMKLN